MKTPQTYSEWLNGIANNIERYGHYQAWASMSTRRHFPQALWNEKNRSGLCCVIVNPTNDSLYANTDLIKVRREYEDRLKSDLRTTYGGIEGSASIVWWSDYTPTSEVIATLRRFAKENAK